MMWKLRNVALAAALGFAVSAPLYAADTYQLDTPQNAQGTQSAALSDADVTAALNACDSWTGTEQAKCVVNIRPTIAMARAEPAYPSTAQAPTREYNGPTSANGNTVKDGTPITEAEYAAAVKDCESASGGDKDRCIHTAKEHFGRM
jgi:hypothetical protein